jgi:heat shock protein HslJ
MHTLERLIPVLCLLLAAAFSGSAVEANPFNLAGTEWGFAGETSEAARFVQFRSNGKVSGFSGCNRFIGNYTQNGDALTIGPIATTRMTCRPSAMKREQRFLAMLANVRLAEGSYLKLILKKDDGEALAELVRRDPN